MNGFISLQEPIFKYNYKGFSSIINQVIDISYEHNITYNNYNLLIKDKQIGCFYDLKNISYNYDATKYWIKKFLNNNLSYSDTAHTKPNLDFLKKRNLIYINIFNLKDDFSFKINYYKEKFKIDKNTLGVQIRGTDKSKEIPRVRIENIFKKIDFYIENYNINKIFLATDENYYLEKIREKYKNTLVFFEKNIRSNSIEPIHFSNNRNIINSQVLLDIYMLSNCKYLLYNFSNVGYLALTVGINNIERFDIIE